MATLKTRHLGLCDYQPIWQSMRQYTDQRNADSADECWLLQHHPVYTLGLNGKRHHLLNPGTIPVVEVDRGGQVTYHGPGQLVAYLLYDMRRSQRGVRDLVTALEQSVIALLSSYQIAAYARPDAPGIYVAGAKLGSLGLRVRRGCCYHGLSLNIDMDLTPFAGINPCGFEGLEVTQLRNLGVDAGFDEVANGLIAALVRHLGFDQVSEATGALARLDPVD